MPRAPLSRKREHSCWHTPRGQSSGALPNEESRSANTTQKMPASEHARRLDPAALVLSMRDGAAAVAHPCQGSAESQSHRPSWQFHLWVHFPKNRKLGLKDSSTGLAVYSQLPKGEVMRRVRACVRDMHTVENHSALITEEKLARALCRVNLEDTKLHEPSSTDCARGALQGFGSGQWQSVATRRDGE